MEKAAVTIIVLGITLFAFLLFWLGMLSGQNTTTGSKRKEENAKTDRQL